MIDISKYSGYFHDGGLIDVQHNNCDITLSLESAEMSSDEIQNDIILSKYSTIKGRLHLNKVRKIFDNNHEIFRGLKMLYDSGNILHLEIKKNSVSLDLEWHNYPPKQDVRAYSFYKIEAEKIWWENIPDLYDPFE